MAQFAQEPRWVSLLFLLLRPWIQLIFLCFRSIKRSKGDARFLILTYRVELEMKNMGQTYITSHASGQVQYVPRKWEVVVRTLEIFISVVVVNPFDLIFGHSHLVSVTWTLRIQNNRDTQLTFLSLISYFLRLAIVRNVPIQISQLRYYFFPFFWTTPNSSWDTLLF